MANPNEAPVSRPSDLRLQNCRSLVRLLRVNSPCSKADLVRFSGLSAPTVTAAISDLVSTGLVAATGEGQSSGGRPPELLRFRSEYGYVAGADIGGTRLRMMLADLNGIKVAECKFKLAPDAKDPESICHLMASGLTDMCQRASVDQSRVLQVTIGVPGITNVDRGIVLSAPNLTHWVMVPLREMMESLIGTSVLVDNDVNLAAVGEHWKGAAHGIDDFLFIAMGTGVGSGVFLGGKLYYGARWSAGEVGYLGIPGKARGPLRLEDTGQLENVIGGAGIEKHWHDQLKLSGRDSDPSLLGLRGARIFDRVEIDEDPDALVVLQNTAAILADAISTITCLINPSLIVLGGGVGSHTTLRNEVERLLGESNFPHPAVRTSVLGTEAQLFGAVSLSLSLIESRLVC